MAAHTVASASITTMLITAIITSIAAVASAVAAIWSAKIAIRLRSATVDQARAAADAARAAEATARATDTLTGIEQARRHDEIGPNPEVGWGTERNEMTGEVSLWLYVTPTGPLDYHLTGQKRWNSSGNASYTDIAWSVVRRGEKGRVHVCSLRERPPDSVALRFDPYDPGTTNLCPCGAPQARESGHWTKVVALPDVKTYTAE